MRDIEFVKILLAFGVDVNRQNNKSMTPLDFCTGTQTFLHRHDSFLEVGFAQPKRGSLQQEEMETNELATLLKECGGHSGKCHAIIYEFDTTEKRAATHLKWHTPQEEQQLHSNAYKSHFGTDWCANLAKIYYNTWMAVMTDPKLSFLFSSHSNHEAAIAIGTKSRKMRLVQMAGSRILVLDGGGMKALVEIETLDQIEKLSGKRIIELFDWIVGTSAGAVIALGLVHARLSVNKLRQLFHKFKDPVFGESYFGISLNTLEWTNFLKNVFKDMTMSSQTYPRVIVCAVNKETTNLRLTFFGNHPEIDKEYQERLVWKVARYTSAAPVHFEELDNYVDGGIIANNPASSALTFIQEMYSKKKQKLPISLVVSLGCGMMPEDKLGRTDPLAFHFGSHWLKWKEVVLGRAHNLMILLGNAMTESDQVAADVRSRCKEQGIDYYRFNPHLHKTIRTGETDRDTLIQLILHVKKCAIAKKSFANLMLRFPLYSFANQRLRKMLSSKTDCQ